MITKSIRIGFTCGLAFVGLAASPLRAEEGVAFKNLLGNMGIIAPQKDPIRYRDRAPLVLPPKMALREPASKDGPSADPQWPKDPDAEALRRRNAERRVLPTESETRRMSENNPRLTTEEIRAGRSDPRSALPIDPKAHRGDNARDVLLLSPEELKSTAKSDDDSNPGNVEPVRRTLAEPPSGMRKPTRNASLSGAGPTPRIDQQQRDATPMDWLTSKFTKTDDDE